MMKIGVFKAITLVLIICFALSAGCAKLPKEETDFVSSGSGGSTSGTGGETDQVSYSTPISTTEPTEKPGFSTPPDVEDSGPQYSVIYSKQDKLQYTTIPFDLELNYPPLIFEYDLEVEEYTDQKAGYSDFGSKDKQYTYDRTLPHPNAWYKIEVYDADTAELIDSVEEKQFAKTTRSGEFKIYQPGNLHIEISGNLLTANTTVKLTPENLE